MKEGKSGLLWSDIVPVLNINEIPRAFPLKQTGSTACCGDAGRDHFPVGLYRPSKVLHGFGIVTRVRVRKAGG